MQTFVYARFRKSFNIYVHQMSRVFCSNEPLRGRRRVGTQITYNTRVHELIDITYKHAIMTSFTRCGLLLYRGRSVAHSDPRAASWPAVQHNILVYVNSSVARLTKRLQQRVYACLHGFYKCTFIACIIIRNIIRIASPF